MQMSATDPGRPGRPGRDQSDAARDSSPFSLSLYIYYVVVVVDDI